MNNLNFFGTHYYIIISDTHIKKWKKGTNEKETTDTRLLTRQPERLLEKMLREYT